MDEFEKQLSHLRLAKPSDELDRRMEALFEASRASRRKRVLARPVPLWKALVACAACLAVGVLVRTYAPAEPLGHAEVPAATVQPVYQEPAPNAFDLTQTTRFPQSDKAKWVVTVLRRTAEESAERGPA